MSPYLVVKGVSGLREVEGAARNGDPRGWTYFGVLPFVLRARNKAFSAPRIWTVEAAADLLGCLASILSRSPLTIF